MAWRREWGVNRCGTEGKVDGLDGRCDSHIQIVSVFVTLVLIRQDK